jgi:NAD(P)-dependent dehydrogenase (short-subunit alcohol dehydrogenase family)
MIGSGFEIAHAFVFVASARASFIAGQVIAVNGGKTAS